MSEQTWEDALEIVVSLLEAPPEPDSEAGRCFDDALRQVLTGGGKPPVEESKAAPELDPDLRRRLDDLAKRRAGDNPFGNHPDGIGPTLGMNLGDA